MNIIIVLVGPKGSGKSYIGSLLQKNLDFVFFSVEEIWLQLKEEKDYKSEKDYFKDIDNFVEEGLRRITTLIEELLQKHDTVVIESLGLPPSYDKLLQIIRPLASIKTVKVNVGSSVCFDRIAKRDQARQIQISKKKLLEIDNLSRNSKIDFNFEIKNEDLSDEEIVSIFKSNL